MTARPMFTIPFQSMLNENEEMKDEYVALHDFVEAACHHQGDVCFTSNPMGLSERGGV